MQINNINKKMYANSAHRPHKLFKKKTYFLIIPQLGIIVYLWLNFDQKKKPTNIANCAIVWIRLVPAKSK